MQMRIALLFVLLGSCSPPDRSYDDLLKSENKVEFVKNMDVRERLRLYEKLYNNSGHPPDTSLASAFEDRPGETLIAIRDQLSAGAYSDLVRNTPIISHLSVVEGYDICTDQNLEKIRSAIETYRID